MSKHTCTEPGDASLGSGGLAGLDFLAAGCGLDVP